MYFAIESSTHSVEDDLLPCELMMQPQQLGEESSSSQKRVSFADSALLYSSPLFIEDVRELWYTAKNYASMKEERRTAVKLIRFYGIDAVKRKVSTRGLEAYYSIETNRAMKVARDNATYSVLHEQEIQRQLGFNDAEALRDVYVPATQWMRNRALQLARNDCLSAANRMRLPLTPSIPTNSRTSFQNTMIHQRSQKRLLREDSHDHMDGIISKLESTLHLAKALDSNTSSRTCYDEIEPIRLTRM